MAMESGGRGALSVAATTATAGDRLGGHAHGPGPEDLGRDRGVVGRHSAADGGLRRPGGLGTRRARGARHGLVHHRSGHVRASPARHGVPDRWPPTCSSSITPCSRRSPPTALSPFAAAAITGGNPFRTMMLTWKYSTPAFLVPFMFTLNAEGADPPAARRQRHPVSRHPDHDLDVPDGLCRGGRAGSNVRRLDGAARRCQSG